MRKVAVYDIFNRPDKVFEKVDKTRLVEVAGYVPTQARIEQLLLAGHRLVESRKARYDWPDGVIDESYTDPTRSPGFDLADASQAMLSASARMRDAQRAAKASEALKGSPGEVLPGKDLPGIDLPGKQSVEQTD